MLLGLRAAPKENGISPAEITFGRSLILPGEFFCPSTEPADSRGFVERLRSALASISPHNFNHKNKFKIFVPQDLKTCEKGYIRVDRVRSPGEAPYEGPFEVVKGTKKCFTIRFPAGKTDTVSIDRLKPAYVLNMDVSNESPVRKSILKNEVREGKVEKKVSFSSVEKKVNYIPRNIISENVTPMSTNFVSPIPPIPVPAFSVKNEAPRNPIKFSSSGRRIVKPARYR